MSNKMLQNYEELAISLGLHLDGEGGVIYGQRDGYELIIFPEQTNYPYMLTVAVSAQRPAGTLTKDECKQFKRENKTVSRLTQNGTTIKMALKHYPKQEVLRENLNLSIQALTYFLHQGGFRNCCQVCGKDDPSACFVSGGYMHLCPDCFGRIQHDTTMVDSQKQSKHENVVGGIVGALLGSLLGVLSIVIFSQLGYVAAVSGVIMAVCTLKGYEMLGGKLTKKGIVISVILMILMTLVGDRVDWAIALMKEVDVDFISAYRAIPQLLKEEIIDMSTYVGSLLMQYLFVLLGAVPTIISTLKNHRVQGRTYRLGETVSSTGTEADGM